MRDEADRVGWRRFNKFAEWQRRSDLHQPVAAALLGGFDYRSSQAIERRVGWLRHAALHGGVRWRVKETTERAYSEMLRLRLRDAVVPPKSLKARVFSALRDEELRTTLEFYMKGPIKGMPWKGDVQ